MPHIDIKLFPGRSDEMKKAAAEKIVEAGERSEGGLVIPHFRRGYFKRLRSDFYKNKKGDSRNCHPTENGPKML